VSIDVHPGEHVAIVGPSGCGKSTLMRVLLGLDDAESGTILVDDRDLATLDRTAVRRQIGSVLQSSLLLPGPIRLNVDMGRGLPSTRIWEALEQAAVADDVRAMALGLDTPVADGGGTISGGQRQRILIARALAGKPRLLIFDEATSALDNITQADVVAELERLQLTRIVIAHRLATVKHADRILVMDAGRIVDMGTYDELMGREGLFREIARRQHLTTPTEEVLAP
jgi:ABC-type bacteriocin/lantibiotic exporter with double-glycine peptidase domain